MAEIETLSNGVTTELLEKAFRQKEHRKDIRVKRFTVSQGCESGHNFSTDVLAVKAHVQKGEIEEIHHLILKTPRSNTFVRKDDWNEIKPIAKEATVYNQLIPAMVELQARRGLKPFGPSVPYHLHSFIDKIGGVIVLEDLRIKGFRVTDTFPLDLDHCRLVMKELATFHALGYALKNDDPDNLQKFHSALHEGLWTVPFPDSFMRYFRLSLDLVQSFTRNEKIIAAAEDLNSKGVENMMLELLKPTEPYAVVCHGDIWRCNSLYRYETSNNNEMPVDVKLLDLQLVRYALPTTDLSYFFYTSTTKDLRHNHLKELLALYHSRLMFCFNLLNLDFLDLSLERLESLYKQTALYGIITKFVFLPPVFLSKIGEKKKHLGLQQKEGADRQSEFETLLQFFREDPSFARELFIAPLEEVVEMNLL